VAENAVLFSAALLSWKFFERPILPLKNRWAPR
jgi:peptidoglycan/LPS O-acetylase OafA/YrhL